MFVSLVSERPLVAKSFTSGLALLESWSRLQQTLTMQCCSKLFVSTIAIMAKNCILGLALSDQ